MFEPSVFFRGTRERRDQEPTPQAEFAGCATDAGYVAPFWWIPCLRSTPGPVAVICNFPHRVNTLLWTSLRGCVS
jgi:hypothetical protein